MVIRMNRDTLYSAAVFDLDAGPVTITMPDARGRFMSLQVITEDHYVPMVVYKPGNVRLTKTRMQTRYVLAAVRILVLPTDAKDVEQVHLLQDAIRVRQPGGPGTFEVPNWDPMSQSKIRNALLVLAASTGSFANAFGTKDQVDPVRHLMGSAAGWAGNPDKDARYASVAPLQNDGITIYKLKVKEVPVDAFWSISVYDEKGYFRKNEHNVYSLNNLTAKKSKDGSIEIQFGGYDGKTPNCLPITPGWNYTVRMYRPRKEILTGKWKFPEAQPAKQAHR